MRINKEGLLLALKATEEAAAEYRWNQGIWIKEFGLDCGTGGCLAGNYALAMGCRPVWVGTHWSDADAGSRDTDQIITPEGKIDTVEEWARVALGLNFSQADWLFASENSLDDLRDIVEAWTA